MIKKFCFWVGVLLCSWLLAASTGAAGTKDQDPRPSAPPEQKAEQKPGKKVDPKAEIKPAAKPEQKVEKKPVLKPEQKPEMKVAPKAEKKPDLKAEKQPEQKPEQKPNLKPAPKPEMKVDLKPDKKPAPKPEAKPKGSPEVKAGPKAKVKPEIRPEYYLKQLDEKMAEPKPAKKVDKKAQKPAPKPHVAPAPVVAAPKPLAADDPQAFLARAREKETAGDIAECLQILSRFVNLFPRHPDRAATLLRMGALARDRGETEKARQVYSLAASLYPNSPMAAEARWQSLNLEFYQDLKGADPLASFRNYLQKVTASAPGLPAEKLREPIRVGWQGVERAIRKKSPCPMPLVEEALALWEMHPEGTQPPEAALLLGELLMEKGLQGVARGFLQRAQEQGAPGVKAQALVGLLEAAWDSRNLLEFAGAWNMWRQNPVEIAPGLRGRLEKLPLPAGFLTEVPVPSRDRKPEEDALAALLEWWGGKSPDASRQAALLACLEHFLRRPLPGVVKEKLQLQVAQLQWSQGNFSQAARIYQELLASQARGENSAFYQDRLALTQLKARRPEEALEIYNGLSHGEDNFWQLLSRVRLADVELGRLQAEPLPND